MTAFCNRQGVAINSVRFLFDGSRINPSQTPQELEMEDGGMHALRPSRPATAPMCLRSLLTTGTEHTRPTDTPDA